MLNKALRIPEADVLYKLCLFIQDIFHQIQNESVSDSIAVYLGQTIQRDDFDSSQKTLSNNNLIAFPQFLSCSKDQLRAICVAKKLATLNDNFMPIIIHLDIPANMKCATISSCRYFIDNEKDILLNMGTMARIVKVEKESFNRNQIASIYLILVLKNSTTQAAIAPCCYCLATSCRNQDNSKRALELYLLSLDASLRIKSPNAFELSSLYASIALDSQLHSNNPDLNCISSYTNNIGVIFVKQGKNSDVISSFQRTLKILQQITESHDTELSLTYDNIGDAYLSQFKSEEALNNYNKSIEIQEHFLPRNLSALSSVNYTLGNVYLKLGRFREALTHFKRSLEYQKEYMPVAYSSFAVLYNNIGLMKFREEQYSEALENYFKSLEIASISLPEKHSLIAIALSNIAKSRIGRAVDQVCSPLCAQMFEIVFKEQSSYLSNEQRILLVYYPNEITRYQGNRRQETIERIRHTHLKWFNSWLGEHNTGRPSYVIWSSVMVDIVQHITNILFRIDLDEKISSSDSRNEFRQVANTIKCILLSINQLNPVAIDLAAISLVEELLLILFYFTLDRELVNHLKSLRLVDIMDRLLRTLNKHDEINLQAHRILAIITNEADIKQLQNSARITTIFISFINDAINGGVTDEARLHNSLRSLKD
ncbi:unnamed protein product [Rotaria magnacalcarata]|uniref:ADP ribosyltransferase domain-containing protein n=2 Tax=Rotaria magnacalcarata TaxID=392030 RepID=A0A819LDV8_9BILA|nr:unnamed protein product [Rotaria magnacalcarata]